MSRFLIVDDHPLARTAIRFLLENNGHEVVAETADGQEVFGLMTELEPDMLIIDIDINNMDGLEVIENLRTQRNHTPAIVMSGKNADYYALRSAKSGANGFISKKNNLSDLNIAIEAVRNGYGYFPLKSHSSALLEETTSDAERIKTLSAREFQVLQYLAQGMEVITIATRMKISNKTISTYKSRLMDKLGLKTRTELLDFVRRNQIS
ncbi:response regulator [Ewingella americana]|uniref:response regulator n=1 Tax=Ewingella americana TaxID=41202 RepID=UPI001639C386|nr:response regulator [Ewingella americana]QMV52067.1 response regulator [Ewingella americana]